MAVQPIGVVAQRTRSGPARRTLVRIENSGAENDAGAGGEHRLEYNTGTVL